jgi:hypothetical protein
MWKIGCVRIPARADQRLGQPVLVVEVAVEHVAAEGPPDGLGMLAPGPLVERDADPVRTHAAQVDPLRRRRLQDHPLQRADLHRHRVEERLGLDLEAEGLQPLHQPHGLAVDALGDRLQPLRPVEHRIHRRHHRQERLRGADVRRGLLPPDVLLARLQRSAGRPGSPARRSRRRRSAPASTASARPSPPCRRHAGRHSPSARRSAGSSRPRCPPPSRPAASAASAPADRPPRRRARRPRAARRSPRRSRGSRHGCRDTGRSRRRRSPAPGPGTDRPPPPPSRAVPPAWRSPRWSGDGTGGRRRTRRPSTSRRAGRAPSPPPPPCPRPSRLAFATSSPVRSQTMVWKFSSASSRPWLISGW